jgi:hypothetical protein
MSSVDEQLFEILEKQIIENNLLENSYLPNLKKQLGSGNMKEIDWTLLVEKQIEHEEEVQRG